MKKLITFFCLIIVLASSKAQESYIPTYDQTVCPTVNYRNLRAQLSNGANAFILNLTEKDNKIIVNETIPLTDVITDCQHSTQFITLILKGKIDAQKLKPIIALINKKIYKENINDEWPTIPEMLSKKQNILIFYDLKGHLENGYTLRETTFSCHSQFINKNHYTQIITGCLTNDLVFYYPAIAKQKRQLENECMHFWNWQGKSPHFLVGTDENISQIKTVASVLNNVNRIVGKVTLKGTKLAKVGCIEKPRSSINGRFSFPNKNRISITLQKDGFMFLPETAIQFTDSKTTQRIFEAFATPIEQDQIAYLSFEKDFGNTLNPEQKTLEKGVKISAGGQSGKAAQFWDGGSISFQNAQIPDTINQLTFSAWMMPDSIGKPQGIITLGKSISIKLHSNKIFFTLIDLIDRHSCPTTFTEGKWQHIAVVFNHGLVKYFINGSLIDTDTIKRIAKTSGKDIEVGNNLWGQSFTGKLDEIRIWTRALNNNEIRAVYELKPTIFPWVETIVLTIILLILTVSINIILRKRKQKLHKTNLVLPAEDKEITSDKTELLSSSQTETIQFFGRFEMTNKNGEHFEAKFFPKIQQLFILIAIYTVDRKGIPASEINEILWSDVSSDKATNARGTSIQKIRVILKNFDGIRIESIDKTWRLVTDSYFDYQLFMELLNQLKSEVRNQQIDTNTLMRFISIINNKPFLPGIATEWLDEIKAKVTENIINILLDIWPLVNSETALCLDIADTLFTFDELNEEALEIKITSYLKQGKMNLAQNVYNNFTRKYQEIIQSPFEKSFEEFCQD